MSDAEHGVFATYPSLRGAVAFVSGGASGLGVEFVTQLAAQGARVGFVDILEEAGQGAGGRRWRPRGGRSRCSTPATCATLPRCDRPFGPHRLTN